MSSRSSRARRARVAAALALAVVLPTISCDSPAAPDPAALARKLKHRLPREIDVAPDMEDSFAGVAGEAVAAVPTVIVLDKQGRPRHNVRVRFRVSGGGSIADAKDRTRKDGLASAGVWTLGTRAGTDSLVATAEGVENDSVVFLATVRPGAPALIVPAAGDGQRAMIGSEVDTAPAVRVTDRFGNAVAGVPVTFAVTAGGGAVAPAAPVVTGADGVAAAASWLLGDTVGTNAVAAASAELPPATLTATGTVPTLVAAVDAGTGPTAGFPSGGVAVNTTTHLVYLTSPATNTVHVLDGQTLLPARAPIAVGAMPSALTVNSVTNRIYVANRGDRTVSVIDGHTHTLVATVPVGLAPDGIAVNMRTNRVFVMLAPQSGGTIRGGLLGIDGYTNQVVTEFNVTWNQPALIEVAVDSTLNQVYVTDLVGRPRPGVRLFDGTTGQMVSLSWVPSEPGRMVVNSRTGRIYVQDHAGAYQVRVIDGRTMTLAGEWSTAYGAPSIMRRRPTGLAVNPRTNAIFLPHGDYGIRVVSGRTNNLLYTMPVPTAPLTSMTSAVDDAANRIYFRDGARLVVIQN